MKKIYLAGEVSATDGWPGYPDKNALFASEEAAKQLYSPNGIAVSVTVYESVDEYKHKIDDEKRKKARQILTKAGYSESEAKNLVP